MIVRKNYFI